MIAVFKKTEFKPLPADIYRFVVTDCALCKSTQGWDDFYSFKVQVNDESEQDGLSTSYINTAGSWNDLFASFLTACGLDISGVDPKKGVEFDTDVLLGCEFVAEVKVEKFKKSDKLFNKFVWFKSAEDYQKQIAQVSQKLSRPSKPLANAQPELQPETQPESEPVVVHEQVKPLQKLVPNKSVSKPAAIASTGKKLDFPA
ncbi:MAG: hypothetical protein M0R17_01910 [Candidatus Omnitrophica bacterium]|jgi:hypothetical protein|nr:hypothetical protein [Candidatus Omnitrophota bacterium]